MQHLYSYDLMKTNQYELTPKNTTDATQEMKEYIEEYFRRMKYHHTTKPRRTGGIRKA